MQVAITIFWLGKYAQQCYEGPQLDFSAFSDLVNHHQYKSVLQLSPTASASRSEDSDSTASSHQGSPRPPAKRNLTLESVQEDLVESDLPENLDGNLLESPEVDCELRNHTQSHNSNEGLNSTQVDLNSLEKRDDAFDSQLLDSGDFVIKPPSPFAEGNVYHQVNASSPVYENQSPNLPAISTNQEYIYGHTRHPSGDSVGYSSAYGSCYSAESKTPSQSEYLNSPRHARDNSYDSLLSEDRSTSFLNEDKNTKIRLNDQGKGYKETVEETVPVHYDIEEKTNMAGNEGKTSANIRYSATFDAVYDQENRPNSTGKFYFIHIYIHIRNL